MLIPILIGAAVGAGVSEATGGDWETGAMYGAGGGAALGVLGPAVFGGGVAGGGTPALSGGGAATTLTAATFTANQRPASGYILVDSEIMKYSGATKSSTTGTLTLDSRGCFGTTAASHTGAVAYVLNTVKFHATAGDIITGMAVTREE